MALMGKCMSIFFLFLTLISGALLGTAAEVYRVGDAAGWTSDHGVNYTAWASSKTFKVGDTLAFVYNKNHHHSVVQVSRDDYHLCDAKSPVATYDSGYDHVPVAWKGHYFYISGNRSRCAAGQKVDIRVLHGTGNIYRVGDAAGWSSSGYANYSSWASSKNFRVGDIIVFSYNKNHGSVIRVSRDDYHSCNAASPIRTYSSGYDHVPLVWKGHYFYISGNPGDCAAGQRVDIRVLSPADRANSPRSSPSSSMEDHSSVFAPVAVPAPTGHANSSMGLGMTLALLAMAAHMF